MPDKRCVILCLMLLVFRSVISSPVDKETYTHVQNNNIYCSSQVNNLLNKITCDFNQTAARLGDIKHLVPTSVDAHMKQNGILHLDIKNCSALWISKEFLEQWRAIFSTLIFTINDIQQVAQDDVNVLVNQTSDAIHFYMKNCSMNSIHPNLLSGTRILLLEVSDSSIGTIWGDSFADIQILWQLRIINSTIEKIENGAMPSMISIAPAPLEVHENWFPFLINETRINRMGSDSLQLNISQFTEFINFINCKIQKLDRYAIRINGMGHVLFSDCIFDEMEDDSMTIILQSNSASNMPRVVTDATITFIGVQIKAVNISNMFENLQSIGGGKRFFTRVTFPHSQSFFSAVNHLELWNESTTEVDRLTITCSCEAIYYLEILQSRISEPQRAVDENSDLANYDYDNNHQLSPAPNPVSTSYDQIREKLLCYRENDPPINVSHYYQDYCTLVGNTFDSPEPELNLIPIPHEDEYPYETSHEAYQFDHWLFYTLTAVGTVGVLVLIIMGAIHVYRTRGSIDLQKQRGSVHPQAKNPVGIISEVPICPQEEDEEECQL